jgi:hypothetical protein
MPNTGCTETSPVKKSGEPASADRSSSLEISISVMSIPPVIGSSPSK